LRQAASHHQHEEGESGKMAAPICVGVDALALRIREVAKAHDVPIVENPSRARALHVRAALRKIG
jgi:flagellar biosynthesis protein FlhB